MKRKQQREKNREARLVRIGGDIIESERFKKAYGIPHHFDYSVAEHSLDAAACAAAICRRLNRCGLSISEEDVVRASLLHDIGMTQDEIFESLPSEKAYTHPVEGARIAREEFGANDDQLDAILFHMWPIGRTAPHHVPGWILVAADKLSSMQETGTYAVRSIRQRISKKRGSKWAALRQRQRLLALRLWKPRQK